MRRPQPRTREGTGTRGVIAALPIFGSHDPTRTSHTRAPTPISRSCGRMRTRPRLAATPSPVTAHPSPASGRIRTRPRLASTRIIVASFCEIRGWDRPPLGSFVTFRGWDRPPLGSFVTFRGWDRPPLGSFVTFRGWDRPPLGSFAAFARRGPLRARRSGRDRACNQRCRPEGRSSSRPGRPSAGETGPAPTAWRRPINPPNCQGSPGHNRPY
jgi:hypothetical protein